MKSAFKIAFILLSSIVSVPVFAQSYSLEGGYVNMQRTPSLYRNTYFQGGKLGLNVKYDLNHNFYFVTGGAYTLVYDYDIQISQPDKKVSYTTFGHYLSVPLQAEYLVNLSKNFKMFAIAGPTLSLGLAHPQNVISKASNVTSGKIDLFDNSLSRFNIQMTLGGGFQWKQFRIKSGYDFGFININRLAGSNVYQNGWFGTFVYEF